MDIAELIEIALANSDDRRVEIAALEPAEVSMEAVSGLAQLVAELVDNALAFSAPEDLVRVTGLHDQGNYLISISDRGVGIPDHLMVELNRLLLDPGRSASAEHKPGIALVARLAHRHGIDVRLVPGAPGTTARVTVPGRFVSQIADKPDSASASVERHRLPPRPSPPNDVFAQPDEVDERVELTRFERDHRAGSGVVAMSEEARSEAEAFLERVFAPLMDNPGFTERPPSRPTNGNGNTQDSVVADRPSAPERGGTVTTLRVRVPGENFSLIEDDPSTIAAEGAIDLRSALTRYQQGRRTAEESKH